MTSPAQPAKPKRASTSETKRTQPTTQPDSNLNAPDSVTESAESLNRGVYSAADVLQLQRTVGNRATQRQIVQRQSVPKNTIQRLTYDDGDWASVTQASIAASANPVFFLSNGTGQTVVLKALNEAPQRAMFAQGLMEDVAEVNTADTRILDPRSLEATQQLFPQIVNVLVPMRQQVDQLQLAHDQAQTKQGKQDLLDQIQRLRPQVQQMEGGLAMMRTAKAIMVMESVTVVSFSELGTDKANQKLGADQDDQYYEKLFTKAQLWNSLGRIFVVDQFLGNEDRLETFKLQNVFINPAGELVALDNDAILQQYVDQYTVTQHGKQTQKQLTPQKYTEKVIGGGMMYDYSEVPDENIQERFAANVKLIAGDITAAIGKQFQNFVGRFSGDKLLGYIFTSPAFTNVQATMEQAMITGADDTRKKILKMLGDGTMRQRFQQTNTQYEGTYGKDRLFNQNAMEMRGKYLNERQGKDDTQAMNTIMTGVNAGTDDLQTLYDAIVNQLPVFAPTYVDVADANQKLTEQRDLAFQIIKKHNIEGRDSTHFRQAFITRSQTNRVGLLRSLMLAMMREFDKKKTLDAQATDFDQLMTMAGSLYAAIPSRGVFGNDLKLERRRKVGVVQTSIGALRQAFQNV